MIIVHDTFVCKPGNASKLAKLFKETMTGEGKQIAIMTDMSGQYHRVIMASWHDNLSAYEAEQKKWENPTEEMKKMNEKYKGMQEMYVSGSREFFKVW